MRFELREAAAWLREQFDRACFWRWEITRIDAGTASKYDIIYAGRKAHRKLAGILLRAQPTIDTSPVDDKRSSKAVIVSELPIPGALCVPHYLRAIVPLGRPIEEIMAGYDNKLQRTLLKQRKLCQIRQTLDIDEIDRADREMIQPFAKARHGSSANLLPSQIVRKTALEYGRLDLVSQEGEVVACMLGQESIRAGKRYWIADRCGYPEKVFSDPKRLGDANSINHVLAIERAIENGFDYCDFALCFARPDDGLLQFKRRRGAEVHTIGLRGHGHFHIRLPKVGAAQFLWETPLFAVERNKLTLHLGLPEGSSDDEFTIRYRQMGFGGLSKVYLHCDRPPRERVLATLRSFYRNQHPTVIVKTDTSS